MTEKKIQCKSNQASARQRADEPLLAAEVEEIIPKNNLEKFAEWKEIK